MERLGPEQLEVLKLMRHGHTYLISLTFHSTTTHLLRLVATSSSGQRCYDERLYSRPHRMYELA